MTLTGSIWPNWRPWTIDIDRGLPLDKLEKLSDLCKVSPDNFDSVALRHISEQIAGDRVPSKQIWPWILSIGARNRLRTGGLQYCPLCLKEDAYFRIQWRLAWHTCCTRHRVLLLDSCPHCSMPIEPHLLEAQQQSITVCSNCLRDLQDASLDTAPNQPMRFQQMAETARYDGYYTYSDMKMLTPDWFKLVKFFMLFSRRMAMPETPSLESLAQHFGLTSTPKQAPKIESADTKTRVKLFEAVTTLLGIHRKEFVKNLKAHEISQQGLCPKGVPLPDCLSSVMKSLAFNSSPKKTKQNVSTSLPTPRPWHEVKRRAIRVNRKTQGDD